MGGVASAVGSLFGWAPNGANYQAQAANVRSPVTDEQAKQAYEQVQGALTGQQQLAQQLAAQGGLQNQAQAAQLLSQMAQGQGPNPAQNMLNQSTGQNVANQAALMAGQRGAQVNPALIARMAGQQGAGIQQQAAGQAATMGAQQQIAAMQGLGNMANQQVANQMAGQTQYNQLAQNEQQNLLNSIAGVNSANVQMQSNMNAANQAMAGVNANNTARAIGGLASGLGGAGGLLRSAPAAPMYEGGQVPHLNEIAKIYGYSMGGAIDGEAHAKTMEPIPGTPKVKGDSPKNDTVPAKLSPGEMIIPKSVMESEDPLKAGTKFLAEALAKQGKGNEKSDFKEALQRAAKKRKT